MRARIIFIYVLLLITQPVSAGSIAEQQALKIESSIEKLDRINYLPNLLPVILKNRDFIGLTDEQVTLLEEWRSTNREAMLARMQEIASKRIEIKQAALSPTVSAARLQQMQNDIFRLQREILEYKLSCRDHVVRTFNEENWDSFFMVLADEGMGVQLPVSIAGK
jgi:hypothetical protein